MKKLLFTLVLLMVAKFAISAPYVVVMEELDFGDFLPISGSCTMDYATSNVTGLLGTQMCISSINTQAAHYRMFATPGTNVQIKVARRNPQNGDGLTFIPIGQLTSDVDDITIVPDQNHTVNAGTSGVIEIKFGGTINLAVEFTPNSSYEIEIDAGLSFEEVP